MPEVAASFGIFFGEYVILVSFIPFDLPGAREVEPLGGSPVCF